MGIYAMIKIKSHRISLNNSKDILIKIKSHLDNSKIQPKNLAMPKFDFSHAYTPRKHAGVEDKGAGQGARGDTAPLHLYSYCTLSTAPHEFSKLVQLVLDKRFIICYTIDRLEKRRFK